MTASIEPFSRAYFAGRTGCCVTHYADISVTPEVLQQGGLWFVAATFEGELHAWKFTERGHCDQAHGAQRGGNGEGGTASGEETWVGPQIKSWTSSMSAQEYIAAVSQVRKYIRRGEVYQVNICRQLTAPFPAVDARGSAQLLHQALAHGNPAPHAGFLEVSGYGDFPDVWVVSASPELFVQISADGTITSSPIKGTAANAQGLLPKDEAENVMITDLVRNDLQQICDPGSVETTSLLRLEQHPGLVHLVSTVQGRLRQDLKAKPEFWADVFRAIYPPASVSGAPKRAALRIISELEYEPRGTYCGAVGWLDASAGTAVLAVGIRSFTWQNQTLSFGTGAGITWHSDPWSEWQETELKASRLIALTSGTITPSTRTNHET